MILIKIYFISWIILTLIWVFLLIKNRKNILLFKREYMSFVLIRWKVIIFVIATLLLCYVADLWLDPTWDIPETLVMSFLTYYTAPYSVWIIYRYVKWLNNNLYEFYIAIILLFFSSAWFYDVYTLFFLLWEYPIMAFSNLALSPPFYILAWMLWNLNYNKNKWVYMAFSEESWVDKKSDRWSFFRILLFIIPIILYMVIIFWAFIYIMI